MVQHPQPADRRPWQFSLGALFIAVLFAALTCAAARFVMLTVDDASVNPMSQLMAFFAIPVLFCGGIGVLRSRLMFWLGYGVALDLLMIGLGVLMRLAP
jgi:hypothetical protein